MASIELDVGWVFLAVRVRVTARVPGVFGAVAGGVAHPAGETVEAAAHAHQPRARVRQTDGYQLRRIVLVAHGTD